MKIIGLPHPLHFCAYLCIHTCPTVVSFASFGLTSSFLESPIQLPRHTNTFLSFPFFLSVSGRMAAVFLASNWKSLIRVSVQVFDFHGLYFIEIFSCWWGCYGRRLFVFGWMVFCCWLKWFSSRSGHFPFRLLPALLRYQNKTFVVVALSPAVVGVEGVDDTNTSVINSLIIFCHDGSNLFPMSFIVPRLSNLNTLFVLRDQPNYYCSFINKVIFIYMNVM